MTVRNWWVGTLVAVAVLGGPVAWACTCAPLDADAWVEATQDAVDDRQLDVVALGEVRSATPVMRSCGEPETEIIEFEIDEGYVGARPGDRLTVEVPIRPPICGGPARFDPGRQYLLHIVDGQAVRGCLGSSLTEEDDPRIQGLRDTFGI